jgi:hypothetical protein
MDDIRKAFEQKHPIFAPVDDGQFFDFYKSGWVDGKRQVYAGLNRESLEAMLEDLDWQEQTEQKEQLRRGDG